MTTFHLKCFAVFAMLIDHIGAIFFPQFSVFRLIGRISFPIFCFLLVIGFLHTASFSNYSVRIFCFALISEIPFDLTFHNTWCFLEHQNVFFTLFLGLLLMKLCQRAESVHVLLMFPILTAICAAAYFLKTDYGLYGILFIFVFFLFLRIEKRFAALLSFSFVNVLYALHSSPLQYFAVGALFPLYFYNGKAGYRKGKYWFYFFYPMHLFFLFLLNSIFFLP